MLPFRFLGSSMPEAMPVAEVGVIKPDRETERPWGSSSNASPVISGRDLF